MEEEDKIFLGSNIKENRHRELIMPADDRNVVFLCKERCFGVHFETDSNNEMIFDIGSTAEDLAVFASKKSTITVYISDNDTPEMVMEELCSI